ncbi:MAG: NYN domain-containing protein [Nitrospirae bacterium]|nr:NYN domain-containing protein [Nitrospirota bacterium]
MSSIIVDGYNLIGIQHGDLKAARNRLVVRLSEYAKLRGHDITVVFDGWKSGGKEDAASAVGGVKVIYSRLGDKADLVIKRMISGIKKDWIVITSDREIADHAWSEGCVAVPSEVFESRLSASGSGTESEYGAADDDDDRTEAFKGKYRGNPMRPSKKEKALQRAIKKL